MAVESKAIKVKVFINGVDVSPRYSSIDSIDQALNQITQISMTFESPDQDFIINDEDLKKIQTDRDNNKSSGVFGVPGTIGSDIKTALLNKKIFDRLQYQAGSNKNDDFLYIPSLGESIIDFLDQVRAFIQFEDAWYWLFSGVVIGRTITIGVDDSIRLKVSCGDVLQVLKIASITNSLGVLEPAKFSDYFNQFKDLSSVTDKDITPVPGTSGQNMFVYPLKNFNMYRFGSDNPSLIKAIVYAIYGDVTDFNNYGPAEQQALAAASNAVASAVGATHNSNEGTLDFIFSGKVGSYNALYPATGTIKRNAKACGNFSLDKIDIRVFGNTKATQGTNNPSVTAFTEDLRSEESPWAANATPLYDADWPIWELLTGNLVDRNDLIETCIADRNTDFVKNVVQEGFQKPLNTLDLEDVVNIIGTNTFRGGLWDVTAGGVKILLAGSMTKTVYDALWALAITTPSVDYYHLTSRLEMLGHYLSYRSDLVFYASPKGHIVIEMPIYDGSYFGEIDPETGIASRSLLKGDLIGAISDSVSMENLYSICKCNPQFGMETTIVGDESGNEGQEFQSNIFVPQVAISPRLFFKLGPKTLTMPSVFNGIIKTEDGAQYLAAVELSKANRTAHSLSLELKYNPAFILNRQMEVMDRPYATLYRRAGLVTTQHTSIIKDQRVSMSIALSYVRGWNGISYASILGEPLDSLCIDYAKLLKTSEDDEDKIMADTLV